MGRIYIKESEIRGYVRALIREAILQERGRKPNAEDIRERNKMLNGEPYDRSVFTPKSREREIEYRMEKGYKPFKLRKVSGGKVPSLIGADGKDLTPENQPEAINANKNAAKENKKEYDRNYHGSDKMAIENEKNSNEKNTNRQRIKSNFNPEKDEYTQRWLNMTPEEREAENERRRQEKAQQNIANAKENDKKWDGLGKQTQRIRPTSIEDLRKKIKDIDKKLEQLSDCDANAKKRRELLFYRKDAIKCINAIKKERNLNAKEFDDAELQDRRAEQAEEDRIDQGATRQLFGRRMADGTIDSDILSQMM